MCTSTDKQRIFRRSTTKQSHRQMPQVKVQTTRNVGAEVWPSCWAFFISFIVWSMYNRIWVPNVANWCYQSKIVAREVLFVFPLAFFSCIVATVSQSHHSTVIQQSLAILFVSWTTNYYMVARTQRRGCGEPLNENGPWHRDCCRWRINESKIRFAIHAPLSGSCFAFPFHSISIVRK